MSVDILKVNTDGIEMEYFRFGTGKKVMAILPGLSIKNVMNSAEVIVRVFSMFAEEFTVYVFERRKNLPDEYSIEDMANDQIKVLDALGIKEVALYSISQGGMIALQMAILRPDLVSAMVLGSSSSRINKLGLETLGEWNSLAKAKDEPNMIVSFGTKVYSKDYYERFADIIADAFKGITDEEFERLVILTTKTLEFDVYDRLNEIKCPVLVMGGSEDMIFGVEAFEEIAERIGCEIYIFDGYGHAVYDENRDFLIKSKEFFCKTLL